MGPPKRDSPTVYQALEGGRTTDVDLVLANSSTVFLSLSESTLRQVVALLQSGDAVASAATSSDASLTEDDPDHSRAAEPVPKSRNARYLVGLVTLFLVAAVVGSSIFLTRDSGGGDGSPSKTLRGAIAMRDGNQSFLGGVTECGGSGQNAIVSPGEGITARGGDGQVLGTARLENPSSIEAVQSWVREYRDATSYGRSGEFTQWMVDEKRYDDRLICTLFFEVELPAHEFYQLDMGSSGEVLTLRQDELEATKWLTLITFG